MTLLEVAIAKVKTDLANKQETLRIWLNHGHMNPDQVITLADSVVRLELVLKRLEEINDA